MKEYLKLSTRGNPLGALRTFLRAVWQQSNLDGMLVPLSKVPQKVTSMQLIDNPRQLEDVNPFLPVMVENASRRIPAMLQQHPRLKFGVILRPCEMRALLEMSRLGAISLDRLLTISVDCLKTVPLQDYTWRLQRKPAPDALTQEALQFARQGGVAAYRYRAACQVCLSPQARKADINISVIGLPVRQQLLIQIPDEATKDRLNLELVTNGCASPEMVNQHEKVVSKMNDLHTRTQHQILQGLGEVLPGDIDALVARLEDCAPCEVCMDVCPICSVQRPQRDVDGHFDRMEIMHWLLSCSGCGMCEQACLSHYPLSTIFMHMREALN